MQSVVAYSTMVMTVGLALVRPRLSAHVRLGPAAAGLFGVLVMCAARLVGAEELVHAAHTLARPILTIASTMVLAEAAREAGLLDRLAALIEARAGSVRRQHAIVFFATAACTVLLNNDSTVLILTPLVVTLVRRRYPSRPELVVPFAFAVFLASGVAPLIVSNPMNMIVAAYAGLDFNSYARAMAPIWLVGTLCTFALSRVVFRRVLANDVAAAPNERRPRSWSRRELHVLVILLIVLPAYPLATLLGGPVWLVALAGAVLATTATRPRVVASGVQWQVLPFLWAVLVIAIGLRKVGLVAGLAGAYQDASLFTIGGASALGSALVDNHPMAMLNTLALAGHAQRDLLAALIGGDLGPRLLPVGSLAGLIWLESLRRQHVDVPLRTFVRVGLYETLPVLAVSLLLLWRGGRA